MVERFKAVVLKTTVRNSTAGSNPAPCASRDDVKVNMLDPFSGAPGSSPGPAIEDANSKNYTITLEMLICMRLVTLYRRCLYALLECLCKRL